MIEFDDKTLIQDSIFEEYELTEHEMILDIHMILCPDRVVTDIQQAYVNIKKAIKEMQK